MTAYPWLKLWNEAPTDPKWLAVADMAKSSPSLAWHTFSAALAYANEQPNRGSIVGFDPRVIASFCRVTVDEVRRVIQALREFGILLGERIAKWTKRQTEKLPRPRTANAERQARHRAAVSQEAQQGDFFINRIPSPGIVEGVAVSRTVNAARQARWRERRREADLPGVTGVTHLSGVTGVTQTVTSAVEEEKDQLIDQLESPSCVLPHGGETTPPAAVIQISSYRQKEATHDGKSSRGSRISADWEASPEDYDFAGRRGLDPIDTAADFRDYWLAESGARAVKRDWSAAFKHWCRNAERGASGGGFGRNRNQPVSIIEAARKAMFIKTR